MDARKETGRSALATPTTALSTASVKAKFTGNAANQQPAADVFVGTAMRALRKFADLRLQDARPMRCLSELARATEALSSATWAVEYEVGLRDRGER
jgi:hypothetical protein